MVDQKKHVKVNFESFLSREDLLPEVKVLAEMLSAAYSERDESFKQLAHFMQKNLDSQDREERIFQLAKFYMEQAGIGSAEYKRHEDYIRILDNVSDEGMVERADKMKNIIDNKEVE